MTFQASGYSSDSVTKAAKHVFNPHLTEEHLQHLNE